MATQVAGRDVISACADSVSVISFLTKARYIPLFICSHFYIIFVYVLLRYVNLCRLSFMINIFIIFAYMRPTNGHRLLRMRELGQ